MVCICILLSFTRTRGLGPRTSYLFLWRLSFLTWRDAFQFMDCLGEATGVESLSPITAELRCGLAWSQGGWHSRAPSKIPDRQDSDIAVVKT